LTLTIVVFFQRTTTSGGMKITSIKTKQEICSEVAGLLEKFPDDHADIVKMVHLLTDIPLSPNSSDGNAARSKHASTKKNSQESSSTSNLGFYKNPGLPPSKTSIKTTVESQQILHRIEMVNPRECDPKDPKLSDFLKVLFSANSLARRQENAPIPRMDHASIKKRVTPARKRCRTALSEYLENSTKGCFPSDTHLQDLVNSVKSFRIVFSDAFQANFSEVNIGVDLEKNFIKPEEFDDLCLKLGENGFVLDEKTNFWTNPNDTSIKSAKSTFVNPFA